MNDITVQVGSKNFTLSWLENNPEIKENILVAHKSEEAFCLCIPNKKLPLYISQKDKHFLARFPKTGSEHAPFCPHYDSPTTLSGLSVYKSNAVEENDDGMFSVKITESIGVNSSSNSESSGSSSSSSSVSGKKRSKMSLQALLELLWMKSGFTRWSPRMSNKRNYFVLYKYLTQAAEEIIIKKIPLTEYLYIPEPFVIGRKDEITRSAEKKHYNLLLSDNGESKRMIAIGLLKNFTKSKYGYRVNIKHLPGNFSYWLNNDHAEKFIDDYCQDGDINSCLSEDSHFVAIMTLDRSKSENLSVVNLVGITVTRDLLPFSSDKGLRLLAHLKSRIFSVQMDFDASDTDDLYPDFLLLDSGIHPTELFIIGSSNNEKRDKKLRNLFQDDVQDASKNRWCWDLKWNIDAPPMLPSIYKD